MANICLYKIKVKGTKAACYAFIDMMPSYNADKEILSEEGTDDAYELVLRGDCKWSVSAYTEKMENPQPWSQEEISKIEDGDHWDKTLKDKSVLLDCEIFCNSKDIDDSSWATYEHYNKGVEIRDECPKELHIKRGRDYDTYGVVAFDVGGGNNGPTHGKVCKVRFRNESHYYQGDFEVGDIIYSDGKDSGNLGRIIHVDDFAFLHGKQKIHKKVGHASEYIGEDIEAIWTSYKPKARKEYLASMGLEETMTKKQFHSLMDYKWTLFAYKNGDNWSDFVEAVKNGSIQDVRR